jgi:hypothetical protein
LHFKWVVFVTSTFIIGAAGVWSLYLAGFIPAGSPLHLILLFVALVTFQGYSGEVHNNLRKDFSRLPLKSQLDAIQVDDGRLLLLVAYALSGGVFSLLQYYGVSVDPKWSAILLISFYAAYLASALKIGSERRRLTAFTGLRQIRTLSPIYQAIIIRLIRNELKSRLSRTVTAAKELRLEEYMRWLYLYALGYKRGRAPIDLLSELEGELNSEKDDLEFVRFWQAHSTSVEEETFSLPLVTFSLPPEQRETLRRFGKYIAGAFTALVSLAVLASTYRDLLKIFIPGFR